MYTTVNAPSYLADFERKVPVRGDPEITRVEDNLSQHQKRSIVSAAKISLASELSKTKILPPIGITDPDTSRGRGGGRKGPPYKRFTSAAAMLSQTVMSPIPSEDCLQSSHSSPGILSYTTGSCSSLRSASAVSHRRVRKMKKEQTKDLKWKRKH